MKLNRNEFLCAWVALVCLVLAGDGIGLNVCLADEQSATPSVSKVESWIKGLDDPSYMTRRESFLKLCDRTIQLDIWLEMESKSTDKQRSATAATTTICFGTNGTPPSRC